MNGGEYAGQMINAAASGFIIGNFLVQKNEKSLRSQRSGTLCHQ
jgi:hypothetical protein